MFALSHSISSTGLVKVRRLGGHGVGGGGNKFVRIHGAGMQRKAFVFRFICHWESCGCAGGGERRDRVAHMSCW
jgi:hypothetical protein